MINKLLIVILLPVMMLVLLLANSANAQFMWGLSNQQTAPVEPKKSAEPADPLAPIKSKAATVLSQTPVAYTPQQLIGIAIKGLTGFMGAIMFVLVLYAGVLLMTAQGNTERIEHSKKIMVWATLGVAVMLLSYIVVNFVFSRL